MQTTYVVISFGYWGRGDTEEEATKQWSKAGGRKKGSKVQVYKVTYEAGKDKPWVDDYGTMNWFGERTLVAELIKGKRHDLTTAVA